MTDEELLWKQKEMLEAERAERFAKGGAWQREQTAATILAALTDGRMVGKGGTLDDADLDNVRYAVTLADVLRAALDGGK